MIKEYELRESLHDLALDLHAYDPNPTAWLGWIKFLLAELEKQSMDVDPTHQERYDEMLSDLQDTLHTRLRSGGW